MKPRIMSLLQDAGFLEERHELAVAVELGNVVAAADRLGLDEDVGHRVTTYTRAGKCEG